MIDTSILSGLKRVNISVDKEKTKERVKSLWKGASKDAKHRTIDIADIKPQTIYRIFREGVITPKIVVVMANLLDVDPFYITGDVDENSGWSDQLLNRFLQEKGYAALLDEVNAKAKRKYHRRASSIVEDDTDEAPLDAQHEDDLLLDELSPMGAAGAAAIGSTCDCQANSARKDRVGFSEEDLVVLLRALYLRAQHNESACRQLDTIKGLLLV